MDKNKDPRALEEEFKRLLLERGLLTEITPPLSQDKIPKDRKPVPLDGRPGSKVILEERR